jgi:hypothetical protein
MLGLSARLGMLCAPTDELLVLLVCVPVAGCVGGSGVASSSCASVVRLLLLLLSAMLGSLGTISASLGYYMWKGNAYVRHQMICATTAAPAPAPA